MVENVERFQTQFDSADFGPFELLGQNQIGIANTRAVEVVPALVSEGPDRLQGEGVRVEVVIRSGSRAAIGRVRHGSVPWVVNRRRAEYVRRVPATVVRKGITAQRAEL